MSKSFYSLDKRIQKWVWKQRWPSLLEIQENTIPLILKGDCDVIVSAPTGGGKTEAVFLPIISHMIQSSTSAGYYVIYISPLKALINDQTRRLNEICDSFGIPITPWHGDILDKKKNKSFQNPSGILIITPESLESMLMHRGSELQTAFCDLRFIVIDEIHCFIGKERGKQIQSLVSRIELCLGRRVPRIGMSATLSDYEDIKKFIRPGSELNCEVPSAGNTQHDIKILIKEILDSDTDNAYQTIVKDIFTRLRGSNNLVFTQKRAEAEGLVIALSRMCEEQNVPNEFYIHHGSISKDYKQNLECLLQSGKTPATAICTSTLELGIDIGTVKSVNQIGTCPSVASIRQRLGRSGRRGDPSILRIYNIDDKENSNPLSLLSFKLIQDIAIVELIREKRYEPYNTEKYHFSTLIQQILSILVQYGSFYPKEAWTLLCKEGAFRNVTSGMFASILRRLGENELIIQTSTGQIIIGNVGEKYVNSVDFYSAFSTSSEFDVIEASTGKHIGSIDDYLLEGKRFVLSGRYWEVVHSEKNRCCVFVKQINDAKQTFFSGTMIDVDRIIVEKMRFIYLSGEIYPYLDNNAKERLQVARETFHTLGLDHSNSLSLVSVDESMNEISRDYYFTWAGTKINRTISLAASVEGNNRPGYDGWMITGINQAKMEEIASNHNRDVRELLSNVTRIEKVSEKYDWLLPDELLDLEYANASLDLQGMHDFFETHINCQKSL